MLSVVGVGVSVVPVVVSVDGVVVVYGGGVACLLSLSLLVVKFIVVSPQKYTTSTLHNHIKKKVYVFSRCGNCRC